MGPVTLILILALGVWLFREYAKARSRQAVPAAGSAPSKPPPPPHQRVTDRELDRQVKALRGAMADGTVTEDEAIGSLVRKCGLAPADAKLRLRKG
jgi:hypothetical protein